MPHKQIGFSFKLSKSPWVEWKSTVEMVLLYICHATYESHRYSVNLDITQRK